MKFDCHVLCQSDVCIHFQVSTAGTYVSNLIDRVEVTYSWSYVYGPWNLSIPLRYKKVKYVTIIIYT